MKLVIAEKPSVAKNIAEVLGAKNRKSGYLEGNGYYVSWCVGHLIELVDADIYRPEWKKWSYQYLPIIPEKWQYSVKEQTKEQYNTLYELLHDSKVSAVVCATDAGREGELIFRLLYHMTGCKKPIKRLWISSLEESAIKDGFADLKEGSEYDNLYYSALCRLKADWLVGINATRLFTVLFNHKLTVGRVQTPTLAMLVDREKKIHDFKKEQYFIAHILFNEMDAATIRIDDKKKAEKIAEVCSNSQAVVMEIEREEKSIHPPKLFDLTTLQREANRFFGYTAQQTLDYTQSLYEKKLVTYPRTDSQFLTDDMGETAKKVIEAILNSLLWEENEGMMFHPDVERILNSKKVSDHHAIIPTLEIGKIDSIPQTEKNILILVAYKLLCATGEKHIFETIKAIFECQGTLFYSSGKSVKKNGWKNFEEALKRVLKNQNNDEKEDKPLPDLEKNMVFEHVQTKVTEHFTSPPKHYTEDTLLSAMENAGAEDMPEEAERRGLGTPATRASIIEKLVLSGFVERKNKQMIPTESGIKLVTVLPEAVKSPKMTAEWENDLTLITKGLKEEQEFMSGIELMVAKLVKDHSDVPEKFKDFFPATREREIIGTCPKCGENVYESKVNFYCGNQNCSFSLFKKNKYFESMRKEITKKIAVDLLKQGKAKVKGLYSRKKDTTFDAVIVLDASGQYPQFGMEFETRKNK